MIPKDTHDKVTKDSRAVRDMMTCLTINDRVASDSKEFTKIVEILLRVLTLKIEALRCLLFHGDGGQLEGKIVLSQS